MLAFVVLLALGMALAVFGAVVLRKFPDRPGGKILWQGAEASSVGAGLPLIAGGNDGIRVNFTMVLP